MIMRPVDDAGDILPVLASGMLLKGARAEAALTMDRLKMLSGDWWENPAWGNAIVDMLKESRFTEADQQALASYLSSYIRATPGVQEIREVTFSLEGRQFRYSCVIETEDGAAAIQYEI